MFFSFGFPDFALRGTKRSQSPHKIWPLNSYVHIEALPNSIQPYQEMSQENPNTFSCSDPWNPRSAASKCAACQTLQAAIAPLLTVKATPGAFKCPPPWYERGHENPTLASQKGATICCHEGNQHEASRLTTWKTSSPMQTIHDDSIRFRSTSFPSPARLCCPTRLKP